MSRSIARIETEHASQYLQQLCKHFAHKLPAVAFTPSQGRIPFTAGTCTLAADNASLTLEAEAESADGLARVQDVVERHLVRFAFREPLEVRWSAAETAG
jgi:hypothetical protein